MNMKQILYEQEHFSLQKLSDAYGLTNIKDYKTFLGKLMDKKVILDLTTNRQILEQGRSTLTVDDDGLYEFSCSFYDYIIWDNYGLYYKGEHGNRRQLKSNMEIMALKDYVLGEED